MLNTTLANEQAEVLINQDFWQNSIGAVEKQSAAKSINDDVRFGLYFYVDIALLEQQLLKHDIAIIALPVPDGSYVTYQLMKSQVMSEQLAVKYPAIKTFSGFQLNQPDNRGEFDITPQGFHGVFRHGDEQVFIDPSNRESNHHYRNYYRKDSLILAQDGLAKRLPPRKKLTTYQHESQQNRASSNVKANNLITYKLAMATTGEYAEFHGGTKASALAALVTLVNRLNDVYQRDLAIKFELVAENDNIIFTESSTDPFDNTDADIDVIAGVINDAIGIDNYDIGHLVGTGGGGLASFAAVCKSFKAEGITGLQNPDGEAFYIDYVAHEIGHQFGADHTFNGTQGSCDGNRASNSAYEPGSASTIMGYAGICAGQNLQNRSDPYFHIHSIDQIRAYTAPLLNCGIQSTTNNEPPSVDAGSDFTIPAKTPFTLVGSATDSDGDILRYSWEQFDLGTQSNSAAEDATDDGQRPLFRTFASSNSAERTLPQLSDILSNQSTHGEALPSMTRELNFRLVVRDNQNNLVDDAMKVNVIAVDQGFSVNDIAGWNSYSQTVTWHTADTENAPVACASVDILLSTDSGASFQQTLVSQVNNDGSQDVNLANLTTNNARIKIMCSDNIFFAINNADFTISVTDAPPTKPIFVSQVSITTDEDSSTMLNGDMLTFEDNQTVDSLQVLVGENYSFSELNVTPMANFNGDLQVNMTATNSDLVSDIFQITIKVNAVNDAPIAVEDSASIDQDANSTIIDVLDNDSDIDGDELTLISVSSSGSGSVNITDNKVNYKPAIGFNGTEVISYTIEDSAQASATAALTVSVIAAPITPTPPSATPSNNSSGGGGIFHLLMLMIFLVVQSFSRGITHA